jgi:hypothetical protein
MSDTPLSQQNSTGPSTSKGENALYVGADYKPEPSNWFTSKPYGFRFTPKTGKDAKVMFLPIGPSNLTITTNFATNLIPTIYGTVEEHSPVRYYDIVIEGTTGMAPKFVEPIDSSTTVKTLDGRTSFPIQRDLSLVAQGFFAKTLAAADKIYSDTQSFFGKPKAKTGIQLDQTGYVAFHNLYRFFLKYKKDVSGTDKNGGTVDSTPRAEDAKPPLVFFNHKDNNEYSVVIKSFVLRRDKENPMMYFYTIVLRGYDLKGIENSNGVTKGQEAEQLLNSLGLNGVKNSTFLGVVKEKADQARGILNSIANGVNSLGR